jgi:O-antigen/teichoic acid export membrane protein
MSVASRLQSDGEAAEASAPSPTGRQTALVAGGQGALMAFGGLLALLVAQSFGKSTETDAFFAAYGLYTVGLVFAQTFRLTAVSRVVHDQGRETAATLLGAVALMTLLAAVPMVIVAGPVAHVLVASDPTQTGEDALRILWLALAAQLVAAMLATMLAVRGSFTAIGVATLLTGLVSIIVFVALRGPLGIQAAAVALSAGAAWLASASLAVLWHSGWRAAPPSARLARAMAREAGRLTFASGTFIGTNLAYVVSLAWAARQGHGEATLFSYAYVLAAMLVAITVNVSAMVRSPSLVASNARTEGAAAVGETSFRYTVVLGGAGLALLLLIGPPLMRVALGSGYSEHDAWSIAVTAGCLAGWVLGSAAGIFAVVELLARGQLRALSALAGVQVACVVVLGWAGGAVAGIAGIAVGLSLSSVLVAGVQLTLAFGDRWSATAARMARDCMRESSALVPACVPPTVVLVATHGSTLGVVVAGVLAVLLLAVATFLAWPAESRAIVGVVRR